MNEHLASGVARLVQFPTVLYLDSVTACRHNACAGTCDKEPTLTGPASGNEIESTYSVHQIVIYTVHVHTARV